MFYLSRCDCVSESMCNENLESKVSTGNNCGVLFLPAGFPMGYAAAAPAYSPNMYPGANPTFQTGMCNWDVTAAT